ncbi:MAG: hypothetical protein DMH00_08730 [Acidobacteria bacterium]|nr:MAG: hypothetical protein DMH00_08730 [Acidobacteriota bacterium]
MKSQLELFRRLEREIRLSKARLPIDGFLPSPESLPTEFPDPPPSTLPSQSREMGSSQDADEARRERRKMRRVKKAAPPPAEEQPVRLEDEIQEFINRDKQEGTSADEMAEFLGGFDPSEIPED